MSDDKMGGPAFPGAVLPEHPERPNGMTLRDYFAGQALAGTLARDLQPAGFWQRIRQLLGKWDRTGERCVKCGAKDWMGGACDGRMPEQPERERRRYVLATKWDDGDPGDHWAVGFVSGKTPNGRFDVVDGDGNLFRGNGFRRVQEISAEQGEWLLSKAKEIEASGRSLWDWLAEQEQHEQDGGWRSMDSAPRAWQSIMLHEPDAERNNEVGEGYFDGAESDPGVGENCWKWADGTQAFPTRWRPLPAPPTSTEAEGEG